MPKVLEDFIPWPLGTECHELHIRQRPETVWTALNTLTPAELPGVRLLMGLRSLPANGLNQAPTMLGTMRGRGWFELAGEPQRYIVLGSISQFWRLRPGEQRHTCPPGSFRDYHAPGFAKSASIFEVIPTEHGTLLRTETRVTADSPRTRRRMLAYWRLIRPFSGLIRRIMLRAIARTAAASA